MSSVQVELLALQEPLSGALVAPERYRGALQGLLEVCRYDEPRQELIDSGGLGVLASFVTSIESSIAGLDIMDVLLELLATIACDRNRGTKTRLSERPSLLAFPLLYLRVLAYKKPAAKRNRSMRIAMELLDQLSFTEPSRCASHQEALVVVLLRILENPEDDLALLQHAAEMLSSSMESNRETIHHVAKFNAIPILLRLLNVPSDRMDLKRTVCEALLVVASERELVPIIAANNAIHLLARCLRLRSLHHHVEIAAIKLLDRLCAASQVYGQIVNEELIAVLFQTVAKATSLDVIRPACCILQGIMAFARECKLDVSTFVDSGADGPCSGVVLVHTAATHSHDVALVHSVFQFFTHAVRNPVPLESLVNGETVEGLLALFIIYCGSTGSSTSGGTDGIGDRTASHELGVYLVSIVGSLSRSTVEKLTLRYTDQSLPALFLCLRSHLADLRFVGNTFAIVTRHWSAQPPSVRRPHTLSGFIGIAVELVMQHSHNKHDDIGSKIELMELFNFLREALLAVDGGETVLACGGVQLYRALTQRHTSPAKRVDLNTATTTTTTRSSSATRSTAVLGGNSPLQSRVDTMVQTVTELLRQAVECAVHESSATGSELLHCESTRSRSHSGSVGRTTLVRPLRRGGEYGDYVEELLQREQSAVFGHEDDDDDGKALHAADGSQLIKDHELVLVPDHPVREGGNGLVARNEMDTATATTIDEDSGMRPASRAGVDDSDGNDDANDEENEPNDDRSDSDGEEYHESTDGDPSRLIIAAPPPSAASASPQRQPPMDFSTLDEKPFCFVNAHGVQFPKHPCRTAAPSPPPPATVSTTARMSKHTDSFVLIHDPPSHLEPCVSPDAAAASAWIEQAMRRRDDFLASPVATRAHVVYTTSNTAVAYKQQRDDASVLLQADQDDSPAPHPYELPVSSHDSDSTVSAPDSPFAHTPSLTFDSQFESGNLERAVRVGAFEYDLVLRRDLRVATGGAGHTQWFYFAVSNVASPRAKYRFNIINLCKPDSLFNQGLRPVVYSTKDAQERQVGWRRGGDEICYFANTFPRATTSTITSTTTTTNLSDASDPPGDTSTPAATQATSASGASGATFYTLTFTLAFANLEDTYLLAHSYPYTFSDHQRHLQQLLLHQTQPPQQQHQQRSRRCRRRPTPPVVKHSVLCETVLGRPCDLLTITDFATPTQQLQARKAVYLTARVHPGEAQASWIMRGLLDFLVSDSESARLLRRLFVFRVVPMLNPDGVAVGNTRCSLSGVDLNRHWHAPSPQLHPTIFHTKQLIHRDAATRGVVLFCDLHGHSRKKNVFLYGCDTKKTPNPRARGFARVLAAQPSARPFVSYADCSFKVSKDKETTARVVLHRELQLSWCFTLEASFSGASFGDLQHAHFTTTHLQRMGSSLGEALLQASITDAELRDKVRFHLEDDTVCLASLVDSHLRETGLVSDTSGKSTVPVVGAVPTPALKRGNKRETRGGVASVGKRPMRKDVCPLTNKTTRRQRQREERDGGGDNTTTSTTSTTTTTDVAACPPVQKSAVRRVASTRGTALGEATATRQRSSSVTAIVFNHEDSVLHVQARTERKRDEQAIGKRAEPCASRRHASISEALPNRRPPPQSLLDLMGGMEPPDEQDTQLFKLQSLVRGGSSGSSSSSTPDTPSSSHCQQQQQPPVHPGRRISMACSAPAVEETESASLVGFTPVTILPPPLHELLLARSPKPPITSLRFKGGGRQYAAVATSSSTTTSNSARRAPGPVATKASAISTTESRAIGYESDLIHASAISLRRRTSASALQTSEPMSGATPPLARSLRMPHASSTSKELLTPEAPIPRRVLPARMSLS